MSEMDIDKATTLIPVFTGAKNLSEFINTCDIVVKSVDKNNLLLLIKIINSKLAGNALEATKYRDTEKWEDIKSILKGAFEHRASERTLTIGLHFARMEENESVTSFASRVEELYYNLCTEGSKDMSEEESRVYKKQLKNQALIIFVNGLPKHLNLALKARDPKTLETAMQFAKDEEMEHNANLQMEKLTKNIKNQNLNRNNNTSGNNNISTNINNNNNGCFNCGKNNHLARDCRLPRQNNDRQIGRKVGAGDSRRGIAIKQCLHVTTVINNNHVILESPSFNTKTIKLLIDTGSDLNIVKINKLIGKTVIDESQKIYLKRINEKIVPTIGKTTLKLIIDKKEFITEFQVVNKQFPVEGDGILEKSMSPFNAPLLLVKKKADASGKEKFRIVIDFRALNNVTINEFHPLPNITEILDQLGQSQLFSIVDLKSGYHQISLSKESRELTAFSINQGHYHYKRMSMGLASAPSTFVKAMTNVMAGLIGIKCLVYLDDIIIYGKNLNDHIKKLIDVFERLRHIISEHGIKPDPNKIVSVMNFPAPKNVKQIKSFLGLSGYYRKFINNYSSIANPMTNLLRKDVKFNWDDKCQQAFDKLKTIPCSEPILQYPDFTKEFILTTDASGKALGAILSQGKIGSDLPISYASRTLNNAELNYSTTELQCLAIIFGVKHFRPYLYGRKCIILTDHRPLSWLFNLKDPLSKLARWRIELEQYNYEIKYKPGVQNSNVDALSRMYNINEIKEESYPTFLEKFETIIITNKNVKEVHGELLESPNEYHIVSEIEKYYNFTSGIKYEIKKKFVAESGDEIDVELLIGAVKNYPEIWNVAAETYHDSNKKRGAWIKICEEFCQRFNEKNDKERNEICKYI
ncbi:hypothetical protein QTP88_028133 [Uroleucon formosanum]